MITKVHNNVHIVTQTCSEDFGIAEPVIAVHSENTPLIILTQDGRDILINTESINDLIKALKLVKSLI